MLGPTRKLPASTTLKSHGKDNPVISARTSGHPERPTWLLCGPQLLPGLHEEPTTKASTRAEV